MTSILNEQTNENNMNWRGVYEELKKEVAKFHYNWWTETAQIMKKKKMNEKSKKCKWKTKYKQI